MLMREADGEAVLHAVPGQQGMYLVEHGKVVRAEAWNVGDMR